MKKKFSNDIERTTYSCKVYTKFNKEIGMWRYCGLTLSFIGNHYQDPPS